ncbi:hypothetical protein BLOT_000245 [Blomia tropicalis]|nr:hypothetical protein BLOT_000245 [Blomia tropicalis]
MYKAYERNGLVNIGIWEKTVCNFLVEKRGQLLYTNNMGHESNSLMNNQLSHFINRSGFVNKILPLKLTIRTIVFGGWFGHHVESTSKQMCRSNKLGFECFNVTEKMHSIQWSIQKSKQSIDVEDRAWKILLVLF